MRSRTYYQLNTALAAFMLAYNIFEKDLAESVWFVLWGTLLLVWFVLGRLDDKKAVSR